MITTDNYFNNSKDGNAEPETFDGSIKLQLVIVFLYGFLYITILTGSVAIYIYKREKYKKGNNWYFVILLYCIIILTLYISSPEPKIQVRFFYHSCPSYVCNLFLFLLLLYSPWGQIKSILVQNFRKGKEFLIVKKVKPFLNAR